MLLTLMLALPLTGALAAWLIPSNNLRPWVMPPVAGLHLLLTLACFMRYSAPAASGGWIAIDAIGMFFLLAISALFCACAVYAVPYLRYRTERDNRVLCLGMQVCLAAMTLAAVAHHLGLLWLAIETTTLAMAPLIYFNRNARSIEATWKYLMICSVGIALALLGLLILAYSLMVAGLPPTLQLDALRSAAPRLPALWLHAAFILFLVGYGTKMGLAPMHTWKPDAYGEAPGLVGALLAGGLTNCGLLGLIRIYQICISSGDVQLYRTALSGAGIFSLAVAAVFLLRQTDFKRMLAYSSVEHMGLFTVALAVGGAALKGFMLHLVGNSLIKGVLFLTAGNIHRAFASKHRDIARGVLRRAPWSGGLFLLAFAATTGTPPFLPFFSEYLILAGAVGQKATLTALVVIVLLMVAFAGMAMTVLPVVLGEPPKNRERTRYRDNLSLAGPPTVLLALACLFGIWLPEPLNRLLAEAAALLGGGI